MNRHEFYDRLNKYKSLSHGSDYKYYNKIDLGNGKTRYFYTKAEWDAYQDGKGQEEYKIKKIMEKSKKPTQRESYTIKENNTYGNGTNSTTYFARDNGTSRDAALVEKEKRDLYEYDKKQKQIAEEKEAKEKAEKEEKDAKYIKDVKRLYDIYNDYEKRKHSGDGTADWHKFLDAALKFDKIYKEYNNIDSSKEYDEQKHFTEEMEKWKKSKDKEYEEAVKKALPELYNEYVIYKNKKELKNGHVPFGEYVDIFMKLDQISQDIYGAAQPDAQKVFETYIKEYEQMLKEGESLYKARKGREDAIKKSQN